MPIRRGMGGLSSGAGGNLFDRPGFFNVANVEELTVQTELILKTASETYGVKITHDTPSAEYEADIPTLAANDTFIFAAATQTLSAKTLASPKVTTGIFDSNSNELIKVTATSSAVNELTLANAATGNDPVLSATGGNTNIGITLTPKGNGVVTVSGGLTVEGTTTTIDSTTLTVDDKNIEMGSVDSPSDSTADGGGITLKGASDKTIIWDNTNDNWTSNQDWNIASGKAFKINNVSTLAATALGSAVVTSSLTTVGALASGTIASGFGAIDNGSSAITTTGTITGGSITADNLNVNGNTITATSGAVNITPAAGSAIVLDGTINVDAGVLTGATSITSTAFVGDITGDVTGGSDLATTITATANNTANETVYLTFVDGATGTQGIETDTGLTYNPSSGVLTTTSVTGNLTGNVTGNTSGTAATVTTAAQGNITSLGTLTTLTVDDIIINGANIGHTSDTDSIAIASNGVVTFSQIPVLPANSIDSDHYVDGSIDNAHIADDAIDSEHYADGSIDNAHIADDAIDSEHYAAGSIDTAHIADNQITLAKMAGGTDGNIISYDASGDPVAIATGSDGQVLTSTGAGSPPAFEALPSSSATAADDIGAGDAAVLLTTSSGNITVDAAANDSDIILKGTDGTVDTTFLTIDGSAAGLATFNAGATLGGNLIIPDDGNIGSASDTNSIAISSAGVVTMDQIPVFSAGINVSGGTIAGTLATAAQANVTSLGTLTTLTVDSVIINGTNIGHTSDTDSMAIASNGVVTFSQIPVLPANSIDSDHYVDGSIDNAHIADDAIDSEHYADGSIDNAHIADDAIDSEHYAAGSIDTAHIADNQITLAKMAGGTDGNIISYDASGDPVAIATGSDGQVLTSTGAGSPPAFEALPSSGKVLQVVQGTTGARFTTTSTSLVDITGLTVNITPSSSSSTILVWVTLGSIQNPGGPRAFATLLRDSTKLGTGAAADGHEVTMATNIRNDEGEYVQFGQSFSYLDSPSTTSQVTYKMQTSIGSDGGTTYINTPATQDEYAGNTSSTIIVMEIGP